MEKRIFLVKESLEALTEKELGKMRDIFAEDEEEFEDTNDVVPNPDEIETDEVDIEDINDPEIFDKVDTSDMDDDDDVIVSDEPVDNDELVIALKNELLIPDVDREYFTFSLKGDPEKIIEAKPMAEMSDGEAFLFSIKDGGYKKIYVKDIIVEE